MIVGKKDRSYTTHKKLVRGKGFMDSMSSALRNVGSYLYQNKDLVAKPLIGAAGELAALGVKEIGKKQLMNFLNRKNKTTPPDLSPKDLEILQNSMPNIIGSGIKRF
jgi:hypothetical protein